MPARGRARSSVTSQVFRLLRGRHFWGLFRIETHSENVELFSNIKLQYSQGAFQPAQDFSAQHWTLVVDQIKNYRLLAEVVSELNRFSGFVTKGESGRNLFVQMLLYADVLQPGRTHIRRR